MLRRPLATLLAALLLPPLPVRPVSFGLAHSWYPQYCCRDDDCRKIDRMEKYPDGSMVIDAGSMHVVIPRGFLQQPSRDNDAHVCAYQMPTGQYVPRCLFLPGAV